MPSEVLARLVAWTRNALLVPVARLETERRTVILRDADGTTLVEVVDDELSGTR